MIKKKTNYEPIFVSSIISCIFKTFYLTVGTIQKNDFYTWALLDFIICY